MSEFTENKNEESVGTDPDGVVYYFMGENYTGGMERWVTNSTRKEDGFVIWIDGQPTYTNWFRANSSLQLMRGDIICTENAHEDFFWDGQSWEYSIENGDTNQGNYSNLGDYDNKMAALKFTNTYSTRDTSKPFIILRTEGRLADADAVTYVEDMSSISAFSCKFILVVGSPTSWWDLYSEENYQGERLRVNVYSGENGVGDYFIESPFVVKSLQVGDRPGRVNFDVSTLTEYKISNKNYPDLDVKIRLEGASDDTLTLSSGGSITLDAVHSGGNVTFNYDGHKVQQIDFNNGKSSDDLDFNGYNHSTSQTVTYNSGDSSGSIDTAIDLSKGQYLTFWMDGDGIGGEGLTQFEQELSGSILNLTISKN